MKILIVEDEYDIATPTAKILKQEGYLVDIAEDGEKATTLLGLHNYDLMLLDLNLPGIDGITIAKRSKEEKPELPIIMLTARNQLYDKLTGFNSGTDDYMTKPFSMEELLARIKALLRRSSNNVELELHIKNYKLDIKGNRLVNRQNEKKNIVLSTKEMGILEYLVRHKNETISSEELLEHVWDSNIDFFTSTVKTHMKTLRQKLGDLRNKIITIKGKGYRYNE